MKVLLINPLDIIEDEGTRFFKLFDFLKNIRVLPPLGLSYVAAMLKKEGVDVKVLDANALRMDTAGVKEEIRKLNPEVVGVTATTPTFRAALLTCRAAKEVKASIFTVLGGVHVTVMPQQTIKYSDCIDAAVYGEGELTMLELVKLLESGGEWRNVKGIVFRGADGAVKQSPCRERIKELDGIPFPARELLPNEKYFEILSYHKNATSIITSRGCPFKCVFCEREIRGGHFRARSPENVVDEIDEISGRYGFKELLFYDDTFTVSRNRVYDICDRMIKRNIKISWDCRTRVDRIDAEMLKVMKNAGCGRISLGIESADQKVLDALNKGVTVEQSIKAVRLVKEAGMKVLAYFMLGSPGETPETLEKTIEFSKKLSPDFSYYSITVGYPGTDLFDIAVSSGNMAPDYWDDYVKNGGILPGPLPYFLSERITRTMLDGMQKSAYRKFYLRFSYILSRIKFSVNDIRWYMGIIKKTMEIFYEKRKKRGYSGTGK